MNKKLIIGIAIALASVISVVAIIAISGNKNDNSCNHNESEWVIIEKPTCTHNGIKTLNCDKCGGKTEVVPATGHKWEPATCEQAKKCSYCLEEQGNPLGHDYDSKILKDATCVDKGEEILTCTRCSFSKTQTIEAKGHSYILKDSGEDICSICKKESYTSNSIVAVTNLISMLKDPYSAIITSIYAGKYTYNNENCVVVITTIKAKNSYGAMVTAEYVSLLYVDKKEAIYDMKGYAEKQANYYGSMADHAIGTKKQEYLNKEIDYLYMAQDAATLASKKSTLFKTQDVDYIFEMSKELSGLFG